MSTVELLAQAIVEDLIEDMTDRGSLDASWGDIDEETKEEILTAWQKIVERHIAPLYRQADRGSRLEFPDTTGS